MLPPINWLKKYLIERIDPASRIAVLRALKEKGMDNDNELGKVLLSSLPLNYADRFINSTIWIAIVLLVLFYITFPKDIVLFIFSIHDIFSASWYFLNNILLIVQWVFACLFFAAIASLLMAIIATFAYSKRVSQAINKDYLRKRVQ